LIGSSSFIFKAITRNSSMERTTGKIGYSRHPFNADSAEKKTERSSEKKGEKLTSIIPKKEGWKSSPRTGRQPLLSGYRRSTTSRPNLIDSGAAEPENAELPPVPEIPLNQVTAISTHAVEERSEHLSSSDDTPLIPIDAEQNPESGTKALYGEENPDKLVEDMEALLHDIQSLDPDEVDKKQNMPLSQIAPSFTGPESHRPGRRHVLGELPFMRAPAQPELERIIPHKGKRLNYRSEGRRAQNVPKFREQVNAKLNPLRNKLPKGIDLDGYGNLKGTYSLVKTPNYHEAEGNDFLGKEDLFYESYLNRTLNEVIQGATKLLGPKVEEDQAYSLALTKEDQQVLVTKQAFVDLHREDVEFVYGETTFRSQDYKQKGESLHKEAVAAALIDMEPSPAARTVLSSLLTQTFPTSFWKGLAGADGTPMTHLRMINSKNSAGRNLGLVHPDGTREIIKPLGIEAAKLKIFRVGDDYRLLLDWQAYGDAKQGTEHLLPLGKNDVIGIHFQAEFEISGEAARDGRMDMSIVGGLDGIKVTFSGQLDLN
jgi:hypothetical protein